MDKDPYGANATRFEETTCTFLLPLPYEQFLGIALLFHNCNDMEKNLAKDYKLKGEWLKNTN